MVAHGAAATHTSPVANRDVWALNKTLPVLFLSFLNAFTCISLQISFAAKAEAGKQLLVQPAALGPCFQHSFPQFSRRLIAYRMQRLSRIT